MRVTSSKLALFGVLVLIFASATYGSYLRSQGPGQIRDKFIDRQYTADTASKPGGEYGCPDCNVVVIVIDALRADHLGHMGYGRNTSPVIDGIAKGSVEFMNAYSQESYTTPSVATIFSSDYPQGHGALNLGEFSTLSDNYTTLAEALKEDGYRTAAFVFNPSLHERHNLDQGFDLYDDNDEGLVGDDDTERYETASKIEKGAYEWMDGGDGRFFMYLHYRDVHFPYLPPAPYDGIFEDEGLALGYPAYQRKQISSYDGEIAYTDHMIGRIIKGIQERAGGETVFIITSDHGEEFLDHGGWYHVRTLYEEQLRVPLIIHYPGRDMGERVYMPVELVDLAPTILGIVGIERPRTFRGLDMLDEGYDKKRIIAGGRAGRATIIEDGIKYYRYRLQDLKKEEALGFDLSGISFTEEVYDLRKDPYELDESGNDMPATRVELRNIADAVSGMEGFSSGETDLPDEVKARLKDIGYIY